jgi:hypothetical protein
MRPNEITGLLLGLSILLYVDVGGSDLASSPLVPGLYIFGDSTVDCGNNNYLVTLARSDMPPYGRDFANHRPNGRFSNGKISVDYLGMSLPQNLLKVAFASLLVSCI